MGAGSSVDPREITEAEARELALQNDQEFDSVLFNVHAKEGSIPIDLLLSLHEESSELGPPPPKKSGPSLENVFSWYENQSSECVGDEASNPPRQNGTSTRGGSGERSMAPSKISGALRGASTLISRVQSSDGGLLVLTGAGMSVSSGVPVFRAADGKMSPDFLQFLSDYNVARKKAGLLEADDWFSFSTPEMFRAETAKEAWAYWRWRILRALVKPAEDYMQLGRLVDFFGFDRVFVETSNCDGLHSASGCTADVLFEIHGSVGRLQCSQPCCDEMWPTEEFIAQLRDEVDFVPMCPKCKQACLRPNVMIFGDGSLVLDVFNEQKTRLDAFQTKFKKAEAVGNWVVLEIGAGTVVASVRVKAESYAASGEGLVRVNTSESECAEMQSSDGEALLALGGRYWPLATRSEDALRGLCDELQLPPPAGHAPSLSPPAAAAAARAAAAGAPFNAEGLSAELLPGPQALPLGPRTAATCKCCPRVSTRRMDLPGFAAHLKAQVEHKALTHADAEAVDAANPSGAAKTMKATVKKLATENVTRPSSTTGSSSREKLPKTSDMGKKSASEARDERRLLAADAAAVTTAGAGEARETNPDNSKGGGGEECEMFISHIAPKMSVGVRENSTSLQRGGGRAGMSAQRNGGTATCATRSKSGSAESTGVARGVRSPPTQKQKKKQAKTTGFLFDPLMTRHAPRCGQHSRSSYGTDDEYLSALPREGTEPERPQRLWAIAKQFKASGVLPGDGDGDDGNDGDGNGGMVAQLRGRRATQAELLLCHDQGHLSKVTRIDKIAKAAAAAAGGGDSSGGSDSSADRLLSSSSSPPSSETSEAERAAKALDGDLSKDSLYYNEFSADCAAWACGSVVQLTEQVATGLLANGFAAVRPPGHHCEACTPSGFCFFNNVATAAKAMSRTHGLKVLVVDWDVHHGNGTQHAFYEDESVCVVSLHRHDRGRFYPGGPCGDLDRIGGFHNPKARGCNVKIPFGGSQVKARVGKALPQEVGARIKAMEKKLGRTGGCGGGGTVVKAGQGDDGSGGGSGGGAESFETAAQSRDVGPPPLQGPRLTRERSSSDSELLVLNPRQPRGEQQRRRRRKQQQHQQEREEEKEKEKEEEHRQASSPGVGKPQRRRGGSKKAGDGGAREKRKQVKWNEEANTDHHLSGKEDTLSGDEEGEGEEETHSKTSDDGKQPQRHRGKSVGTTFGGIWDGGVGDDNKKHAAAAAAELARAQRRAFRRSGNWCPHLESLLPKTTGALKLSFEHTTPPPSSSFGIPSGDKAASGSGGDDASVSAAAGAAGAAGDGEDGVGASATAAGLPLPSSGWGEMVEGSFWHWYCPACAQVFDGEPMKRYTQEAVQAATTTTATATTATAPSTSSSSHRFAVGCESVYQHCRSHLGHCIEVRSCTFSARCVSCTAETVAQALEALEEAELADEAREERTRKAAAAAAEGKEEEGDGQDNGPVEIGKGEERWAASCSSAASAMLSTLTTLPESGGASSPSTNLTWTSANCFGTPLEPILRALYAYKYGPDNMVFVDHSKETDVFAKFDEFKRKFGEALDKLVGAIGASLTPQINEPMGDAEYLLAFNEIVLPVGRAFAPDVILVSCGFDAAAGDPLGGYGLTPNAYAHMTRLLQTQIPSAKGKVVVCLEGGYNLEAIASSSQAVMDALLGRDLPPLRVRSPPHPTAVDSVAMVKAVHSAAGLLATLKEEDAGVVDGNAEKIGVGGGVDGGGGGEVAVGGGSDGGRSKALVAQKSGSRHSTRPTNSTARNPAGGGGAASVATMRHPMHSAQVLNKISAAGRRHGSKN